MEEGSYEKDVLFYVNLGEPEMIGGKRRTLFMAHCYMRSISIKYHNNDDIANGTEQTNALEIEQLLASADFSAVIIIFALFICPSNEHCGETKGRTSFHIVIAIAPPQRLCHSKFIMHLISFLLSYS